MKKDTGKTPEYVKRASANYRKNKTAVQLLLKENELNAIYNKYGEEIKLASYIRDLINKDLNGGADSETNTGETGAPLPWD